MSSPHTECDRWDWMGGYCIEGTLCSCGASAPLAVTEGEEADRAESARVRADAETLLAEIADVAWRQNVDWMHFHELAMAEPFKAEAEAQAFAERIHRLASPRVGVGEEGARGAPDSKNESLRARAEAVLKHREAETKAAWEGDFSGSYLHETRAAREAWALAEGVLRLLAAAPDRSLSGASGAASSPGNTPAGEHADVIAYALHEAFEYWGTELDDVGSPLAAIEPQAKRIQAAQAALDALLAEHDEARAALERIRDDVPRWRDGVGSYAGGETYCATNERLREIARAALAAVSAPAEPEAPVRDIDVDCNVWPSEHESDEKTR